MKALSIQNHVKKLGACMNTNFMKSPLTQNQQKSLHVFHEGPVHLKIWEETSCMYELLFHEVPSDPRSEEDFRHLYTFNFTKSPLIQDQRKSLHFFNNEGPIHPKSWEENFWACMKAPIDPTSAEEHPCFS